MVSEAAVMAAKNEKMHKLGTWSNIFKVEA
jgi:hypothetical protein